MATVHRKNMFVSTEHRDPLTARCTFSPRAHTAAMSILFSALVVAIVLRVFSRALAHVRAERRRDKLLAELPMLESPANETFATTRQGYVKYLKKGQAYVFRNRADGIEKRVLLPLKYLDEVKDAPEEDLSFLLFSDITMLASYSGSPKQSIATTNLVKRSLLRNLRKHALIILHVKLPLCLTTYLCIT